MTGLRLYKKEKLCSLTAIEKLFSPSNKKDSGNNSVMAYPWRAVWRLNPGRSADCPQFMITVPKKRLRHAVDRVTMRRRLREAYRLGREPIPADAKIDIAFIYVADSLTDYAHAERSVRKILSHIAGQLSASPEEQPETPLIHQ